MCQSVGDNTSPLLYLHNTGSQVNGYIYIGPSKNDVFSFRYLFHSNPPLNKMSNLKSSIMSTRQYRSDIDCLQKVLSKYVNKESFTDVTLVSDDFQSFKAHKLVLSAFSKVIERLLLISSKEHTVLHLRGFKGPIIQKMLKMMYFGEVNMEDYELLEFHNLVSDLKIVGLEVPILTYEEENKIMIDNPKSPQNISNIKTKHRLLNQKNISLDFLEEDKEGSVEIDDKMADKNTVKEDLIITNEEREFKVKIRSPKAVFYKVIEGVESIYECVFCSESYSKKQFLNKHTRQKHSDAKTFQCKVCLKNYDNLRRLEIHFHAYHREHGFQCIECDFTSGRQLNVHDHYLKLHKNLFPCDQCDYHAKVRRSLEYHKRSVHEDNMKRSKCDECGNLVVNLQAHIKTKHQKIKFPCSRCPFQATNKKYLEQHELGIHEGIKNKCDHCEYSGSIYALKAHVKTTHDGVRYNCDQCQMKFRCKSQMKIHQTKKHNIMHAKRHYQRDYELFTNLKTE